MSLVYNQVQIYTLFLNGTNKNRKNCLSSESQRLLLLGEMEVFGHFIEEGVGPKTVEVEDGEGIETIGACRHTKGLLPFEVIFDLGEQLVVRCLNCRCHN